MHKKANGVFLGKMTSYQAADQETHDVPPTTYGQWVCRVALQEAGDVGAERHGKGNAGGATSVVWTVEAYHNRGK